MLTHNRPMRRLRHLPLRRMLTPLRHNFATVGMRPALRNHWANHPDCRPPDTLYYAVVGALQHDAPPDSPAARIRDILGPTRKHHKARGTERAARTPDTPTATLCSLLTAATLDSLDTDWLHDLS